MWGLSKLYTVIVRYSPEILNAAKYYFKSGAKCFWQSRTGAYFIDWYRYFTDRQVWFDGLTRFERQHARLSDHLLNVMEGNVDLYSYEAAQNFLTNTCDLSLIVGAIIFIKQFFGL